MKKILILLIMVSLTLTFVGCGTEKSPQSENDFVKEIEVREIEVKGIMD